MGEVLGYYLEENRGYEDLTWREAGGGVRSRGED